MKLFKAFFRILTNMGMNLHKSRMHQKEVVLSNKISLFLIPFAIIGLALSYSSAVYFTTVGFALFIVFLVFVFPLNKFGMTKLTKIGLSVLPSLFLLIPNVISGVGKAENYLAFSYTFIALTIIPLLLFHDKKQHSILTLILFIHLIIILFFDVLLDWSAKSEFDLRLIEDNYVYYKLPQVIVWGLMVSAFQFLKNENLQYERKLEESNNSLNEFNNEIQTWNEEITVQNEVLNEKQLKIEEQNIKLENSNNELYNTKLELLKTIKKLEDAKERLGQKEVEAKGILNALNEHYLIAQYDLSGNLVNINTKVIELLGAVRDELFQHIKPIFDQKSIENNESLNGHYFNHVWEKIKNGQSVTVKLDLNVEEKTKCLATTFTALFDSNNKPYEILAIGQDVTEMIEKSGKIDVINEELKEKLSEISQQNKLLSFQQKEIFDKSEKLKEQKEEIQAINETLELRVKERTSVLEAKNRQLTEYAFINSHVLRSPVSTIMGLVNLISYSTLPKDDQMMYEYLKVSAQKLDDVVIKINNAIDSRIHFDRTYLDN